MNKKTLGIILIVVVGGLAYFGYQKGLFSGGIRGDSVIGMMEKQGETTMSKSAHID